MRRISWEQKWNGFKCLALMTCKLDNRQQNSPGHVVIGKSTGASLVLTDISGILREPRSCFDMLGAVQVEFTHKPREKFFTIRANGVIQSTVIDMIYHNPNQEHTVWLQYGPFSSKFVIPFLIRISFGAPYYMPSVEWAIYQIRFDQAIPWL